jgi:hypothetical protein
MKKNLLEFLYGVSQQEAEVDTVLDEEFAALLEQADKEEAEAMKAEKSPLSAALKSIGITGEALHDDPEGFALITDDRATYLEACAKLADPDAMHTLAVKGWVASNCGDQAMSNEAPEYKIRFLEITTTEGDGESNTEKGGSESSIIKQGREFATEEPDHDDELNPVDHDAPEGNKLKKVKVGKPTDGAKPKGEIKDSLSAADIVNDMLEDCGQPGSRLKKPADGGKVPHAFKSKKAKK